MLLHHAPASQPQADAKMLRIGVGIDTSRYGHYAAFLRDDLQPAVGELQFVESADGYAQLRTRCEQIVSKLGTVHFLVRLDVAGQYADNLLHFLHSSGRPKSRSIGTFTHGTRRPTSRRKTSTNRPLRKTRPRASKNRQSRLRKRSPRPVRAAYHTTPSPARTPSSISRTSRPNCRSRACWNTST